jgi:oligopeptide/dipeptide ABC transporter, ATP-binding protein, C-terminal domain
VSEVLISARDLVKHYRVGGGLGRQAQVVRAVDGVTLDIYERETFALVGESGCGKTTLGRIMLRLQEATSGAVLYRGLDLNSQDEAAMRLCARSCRSSFRTPMPRSIPGCASRRSWPNPCGPTATARPPRSGSAVPSCWRWSACAGSICGSTASVLGRQRQRIGIARALANKPEFVVCDESVSSLDVSIQAQVLNLLSDLQEELKLTYFFITHDLSVVRQFADRVGVMFLGRLVELGRTEEIFLRPLHPYTMLLISAVPRADPHQRGRERPLLTGEIPSPMNLPPGCRFHTRCPFAQPICRTEDPALREVGGRAVACHFPLES